MTIMGEMLGVLCDKYFEIVHTQIESKCKQKRKDNKAGFSEWTWAETLIKTKKK